jgi:hypothetical protein
MKRMKESEEKKGKLNGSYDKKKKRNKKINKNKK